MKTYLAIALISTCALMAMANPIDEAEDELAQLDMDLSLIAEESDLDRSEAELEAEDRLPRMTDWELRQLYRKINQKCRWARSKSRCRSAELRKHTQSRKSNDCSMFGGRARVKCQRIKASGGTFNGNRPRRQQKVDMKRLARVVASCRRRYRSKNQIRSCVRRSSHFVVKFG